MLLAQTQPVRLDATVRVVQVQLDRQVEERDEQIERLNLPQGEPEAVARPRDGPPFEGDLDHGVGWLSPVRSGISARLNLSETHPARPDVVRWDLRAGTKGQAGHFKIRRDPHHSSTGFPRAASSSQLVNPACNEMAWVTAKSRVAYGNGSTNEPLERGDQFLPA